MSSLGVALAILALVNGQRVRHHELPVRVSPRLMYVATRCGEYRPLVCLERYGVAVRAVGVITAWGQHSPRAFVAAWLASPPHREIMLTARYRKAGATTTGDLARVIFTT